MGKSQTYLSWILLILSLNFALPAKYWHHCLDESHSSITIESEQHGISFENDNHCDICDLLIPPAELGKSPNIPSIHFAAWTSPVLVPEFPTSALSAYIQLRAPPSFSFL